MSVEFRNYKNEMFKMNNGKRVWMYIAKDDKSAKALTDEFSAMQDQLHEYETQNDQLQSELAAANNRVSELQAENAALQQELEDSVSYGEHLVSLIRGIVDTESKASDEETSTVYVMAMKMAIVPLRQETLIWQAQDDEDSKMIGIALTPPEQEIPMWEPVPHPNLYGMFAVGIWSGSEYQYDLLSNLFESKAQAQARADELNASDTGKWKPHFSPSGYSYIQNSETGETPDLKFNTFEDADIEAKRRNTSDS